MEPERHDAVRSKLMTELDWSVTSGEVIGAAEMLDEPTVVEAAGRLPDDGSWIEVDQRWTDLRPAIDAIFDDAP